MAPSSGIHARNGVTRKRRGFSEALPAHNGGKRDGARARLIADTTGRDDRHMTIPSLHRRCRVPVCSRRSATGRAHTDVQASTLARARILKKTCMPNDTVALMRSGAVDLGRDRDLTPLRAMARHAEQIGRPDLPATDAAHE